MLRERLVQGWLRREIPRWVARGWVSPPHGEAILADVAGRSALSPRALPLALYTLGALLLGIGIVTYVAANWDVLPRLARAALLLGALWLCYGTGLLLERNGRRSPLAEALKLLGVLIFGANVQLLAQIFHIQAHFPNGVLLWALGGLLTAWVLRSQTVLLAALALGLLWTQLEQWGFAVPFHWPFLLFWMACAGPALRHRWQLALHALAAVLVLWINSTLGGQRLQALLEAPAYAAQIALWANGALFVTARLLARHPRTAPLRVLERYALVGMLIVLIALSSPNLQQTAWGWPWRDPAGPLAWGLHGAGLLLCLMLGGAWLRSLLHPGNPAFHARLRRGWGAPGLALAAALATTLTVNLALLGEQGGPVAGVLNVLLFGGLVWLVYAGYRLADSYLVNAAFAAFAVTLYIRYLEAFWSLLSRSLFFMAGGLLLMGGGWWLDRTRRNVLVRMERKGAGTDLDQGGPA